MATPSNKQLRAFILNFFDEEELYTFCFDYFRDVRNQFGSGMSFNEKVIELIDYCERNGVKNNLLEDLEREKVRPYEETFGKIQKKRAVSPLVYEPQPRNPQKIFVSHSSEDGELAKKIAQDLRNHGYDIFITPTSIRGGEKWVDAIARGLDECGTFLVLLTPNAVKSGWVKQEANTAIALNHENEARLLFLRVEECRMPTLWKQWQHLSFRGKDYKRNFDNLLRELKGELPAIPELELVDSQPEQPPEPAPKPGVDPKQKAREEQIASLYQALLESQEKEDWLSVGMLAAKIEVLVPEYRDVAALKAAALEKLKRPFPKRESPQEVSPQAAPIEEQPEAEAVVKRCAGVTKSGDPCRNKAVKGSDFCGVHGKKPTPSTKPQTTTNVPVSEKPLMSKQALLKILKRHKDTQGYHLYPDISSRNQSKIRKQLELLPHDEEILAFIVATTFGGVQAGMAFSTKGLVWRNDRFLASLSDYSLHGYLSYHDFPRSKFSQTDNRSLISLGKGLGFNHAGWCILSTAEILDMLNDIKRMVKRITNFK